MAEPRLVLHPGLPDAIVDSPSRLVDPLLACGLLAPATDSATRRFPVGAGFPQLLSFVGCAPVPVAPGAEVSVRIPPFSAAPRLLPGSGVIRARCRACRTDLGAIDVANADIVRCGACDRQWTVSEVDWRQRAGVARMFVEILPIHVQEAVPTDRLLDVLQGVTVCAWNFFYTAY